MGSQPVLEAEPEDPEPNSFKPNAPVKSAEIKIIAEAAVEKSLGNIPERRGDYVFPA